MTAKKREPSELLHLLDQRYKELGLEAMREYRAPVTDPIARLRATTLHAQAHASDPWAGARMYLHIRRGIENAHEVEKAARSLLASRVARGEVLS